MKQYLLLLAILVATSAARGAYHATLLRIPDAFISAYPRTISAEGLVSGSAYNGDWDFPVLWDPGGQVTLLPIPPGTRAGYAGPFLGDGRIAGHLVLAGDDWNTPMIWTPTGIEYLPAPQRFGATTAGNGSVIAGTVLVDGKAPAAIWQGGDPIVLYQLPGDTSVPTGINSHGTYVGPWVAITGEYDHGGFIGNGADAHVLSFPGFPHPRAYDINDHDRIVGISYPES